MRRATKIQIAIIAGVLLIAAGIFAAVAVSQPRVGAETQALTPTVAENSHRLDDAGAGAVTFTEFVDFECEVCGAVYPYVEELRQEFAGKVTFVTRYFPLPGHFNSRTSAIAVEAAAQQGKFEEMYHRMFETQEQWGEQRVSAAPRFREFAAEIGLDLAAYDLAVADPATEARIQEDYDAAIALGATGTPTIFIDDVYVELTSPDDLRQALADAVAEAGVTPR